MAIEIITCPFVKGDDYIMWSTKKAILFGGLIVCELGAAVIGVFLKREELALYIAKKSAELAMK